MSENEQNDPAAQELSTKNIRLAIILGLVVICFYAGFFLINL